MFKSKFVKLFSLFLIGGMILLSCKASYATEFTGDELIGMPNGSRKIYDVGGKLKQERFFDGRGRAKKDIDYEHSGKNHKFPHVHDWDWNDKEPIRNKDREPTQEEQEIAKKTLEQDKKRPKSKKTNKTTHKSSLLQKWGHAFSKSIEKSKTDILAAGTLGTILYFTISEGSRILFPVRNLVPVL